MEDFWLSCKKFTVRVSVEDGVIVDAAPIVKKFRGVASGESEEMG